MKKNSIIAIGAALLLGNIALANEAQASDDYDVKAFGPKSPIVWEKPVRVIFEHRSHTDDIGLECSSCHDDVFAMQRGTAVRTGKLTMASLAEGQFCGACHDGDTAFASDTNCTACHIIPEDPIVWIEPVKAVVFYHQTHTEEYGLECDSCHSDAFAMKSGAAVSSGNFTMEALYSGQYCGACHDGETAFASNTLCNKCHIGVNGYKRMTGATGHGDAHDNDHGGH